MTYREDVLTGPYVIEAHQSKRHREMRSLRQTSDSIRCGQHSTINIQKSTFFPEFRWYGNDGIRTGCMLSERKIANPDKTVSNIAGDGCFRMNMNELATASRYDIPIIQVVY